jgi:hypothetical protein
LSNFINYGIAKEEIQGQKTTWPTITYHLQSSQARHPAQDRQTGVLFMNNLPPFAEHLKTLAHNYREIYLALESRYQEMRLPEEFLLELKQREAALIDRFRLVQKELFSVIRAGELDKVLELSRIFDEIRVINQFIIQTVVEADKFATDHGEET